MGGGLMNLIAYGNENIILNGDPKKTFFQATYKKYTNFGMQRFRIDYDGQRNLRFNEESVFDFKIPRYAELLNDTYLVIELPNIYSPVYYDVCNNFIPYEFRWIEDLGSMMIKDITIYTGGTQIMKFTGEAMRMLQKRDANNTKKDLWNRMTGDVPQLNDPANTNGNINTYPNVIFQSGVTPEPSIRGRKLYIPIRTWFSIESKTAFPLISMQYNELHIKVTLRPIRELYIINDVTDPSYNYPSVAPNPNISLHQMYRFLNPPSDLSSNSYTNTDNTWNSDVHLISNYIFLGTDERRFFAKNDQSYLIKQLYEYDFKNVTGSQVVKMESRNIVSSYTWRFRRSDVQTRNVWNNYTNWPYNFPPYGLQQSVVDPTIFITGPEQNENQKNILLDLAIVIDGKYRENLLDSGIYEYIEKYTRTNGDAKDGIYCYNFAINTDMKTYQPSGGMNMNKFKDVTFEFNTFQPPKVPGNAQILCDVDGSIIGIRQDVWSVNEYNFDLHVVEERYNVLQFMSGQVGMVYAN